LKRLEGSLCSKLCNLKLSGWLDFTIESKTLWSGCSLSKLSANWWSWNL